jgi:hypothetical protein
VNWYLQPIQVLLHSYIELAEFMDLLDGELVEDVILPELDEVIGFSIEIFSI